MRVALRVDASREIGIGHFMRSLVWADALRAGGAQTRFVAATFSIAEQFDLLRVVDPEHYPAFFDYRGKRYIPKVEKAASDERN